MAAQARNRAFARLPGDLLGLRFRAMQRVAYRDIFEHPLAAAFIAADDVSGEPLAGALLDRMDGDGVLVLVVVLVLELVFNDL